MYADETDVHTSHTASRERGAGLKAPISNDKVSLSSILVIVH